jgi:hypothetical protein
MLFSEELLFDIIRVSKPKVYRWHVETGWGKAIMSKPKANSKPRLVLSGDSRDITSNSFLELEVCIIIPLHIKISILHICVIPFAWTTLRSVIVA